MTVSPVKDGTGTEASTTESSIVKLKSGLGVGKRNAKMDLAGASHDADSTNKYYCIVVIGIKPFGIL